MPPVFDIYPVHGHLLNAQPKLPTIKVYVDQQEVTAEIARQLVEIATGMMFRTNMAENAAQSKVSGWAALPEHLWAPG